MKPAIPYTTEALAESLSVFSDGGYDVEASGRLSLLQARGIIADLFTPRIGIYLSDILASGIGGWFFFLWALHFPLLSATNLALLVPSILLLFRVLIFIHPIVHLPHGKRMVMRVIYDCLCGLPFLAPVFLYEKSHQAHHKRKVYGTEGDPEYVHFSQQSRHGIPLFLLANLLLPAAVILRFTIIGPVSWIHRASRIGVEERLSAFSTTLSFIRPLPGSGEVVVLHREEIAASCVALGLVVLTAIDVIPAAFIGQWMIVAVSLALLNAVQFMALHRYDQPGPTLEAQVRDSLNTPGRWPLLTSLWAPVGQRFHALHHMFPTLPYHNLPEAHRRLMLSLPANSVYRVAENSSLAHAIAEVWKRTGRASHNSGEDVCGNG